MSQELLQAVLNQPDDDAPRLAYADWCGQQPDDATKARAEFIRGQIRIAEGSLDFWISPEDMRLDTRLANLLNQYGGAWREPLSDLVSATFFKRGFIEFVTIKAASLLRHGDELFALSPVRHMDITDVRDVDERLFTSPHLARLRSLGMDGCGLYSFHVRLLVASGVTADLRWLSLEHNHLDMGAPEAIAASPHCKNLKYAEFNGNPVDPGERMGWDSGDLISLQMPEEGEELEARFGPLPWLHRPNGKLSRFDA